MVYTYWFKSNFNFGQIAYLVEQQKKLSSSKDAGIAQLVEQHPCKLKVVGSSPAIGSNSPDTPLSRFKCNSSGLLRNDKVLSFSSFKRKIDHLLLSKETLQAETQLFDNDVWSIDLLNSVYMALSYNSSTFGFEPNGSGA